MCGTCMAPAPAKIIIEEGKVYDLKRGKAHGVADGLGGADSSAAHQSLKLRRG